MSHERRSQSTVSAAEFIDKLIKLLEEGEPFTLAPYQRRVLEMLLRRDPSGELAFRLVLLSEPKISLPHISPSSRAFRWQVSDALRLLVNKFDAWKRDQDREAGLAPMKKTTAKVGNRK